MHRIRYTTGPDTLTLGALALTRGEWSEPVAVELAEQAMLPDRVTEYGFEVDTASNAASKAPAKSTLKE
jgi:hypothetical protein